MLTPWPHQIDMAAKGYRVLREHMIVYLASEERTGKSLAAVLIAEMCESVRDVLILTTRKATVGWEELNNGYNSSVTLTIDTYGRAGHHTHGNYDLIILDEAHKFIAGYPTPSKTWKNVAKLTKERPLIYISATPHAQGYQQLYHQFALSSWSPWKKYTTFYSWHAMFGIPNYMWLNGRQVEQYNKTDHAMCTSTTEHLMVTKTRKQLGFKHEPTDKLHYIELSESTKELYNMVIKLQMVNINGYEFIADSKPKLRYALHMIEGGVLKIDDNYLILPNTEKIDYIKQHWGDTKELVIFYNYIAEEHKLKKSFKYATILQATAYAEGVDLSAYETLIIYSQDFSTARHTQRRARQANKYRKQAITVHFLLVEAAISEQVYETVSINKENFVDSVFERAEL